MIKYLFIMKKLVIVMIVIVGNFMIIPADAATEQKRSSVPTLPDGTETTVYSEPGGKWWQLNYAVNDFPLFDIPNGRVAFIDGNDYIKLIDSYEELRPYLQEIRESNVKAKRLALRDITIAIVMFIGGLWLFFYIRKEIAKNEKEIAKNEGNSNR